MSKQNTQWLYSLNALAQKLDDCGWNDEAEKLREVRELVWTDDLVFTPSPSNVDHVPYSTEGLTVKPYVSYRDRERGRYTHESEENSQTCGF